MANLWTLLRSRAPDEVSRYSFSDWASQKLDAFSFGGMAYPLVGLNSFGQKQENVESSFAGYVQGAYKANGVVFACSLARAMLFTEARFQWQRINLGRPGDLFGNAELGILEYPWPNGTTGELLARMEQDVSLAGNFYCVREPDRLRRLRPDWVSIVLSAPPEEAVQSDVLGYLYQPGGPGSKGPSRTFLPGEIAHWSPTPDPLAQYRGMSWLTPVLREIQADAATTEHKLAFFRNGATPQLVASLKETVTEQQFGAFIARMNDAHQGASNAYKTMYLGGGADVKVVGNHLRDLDFKAVQGAGETRIAAAARVPPIIVGLSEGLQAATYSNYGQARRAFGDHWARPQWRSACAALEPLLVPPGGPVRLWYDDRDIAFLREDQADAAQIQSTKASTINTFITAGFTPESSVAAVDADDRSLLVHTGLVSVQLQPPGAQTQVPDPNAATAGETAPPAGTQAAV